MEIVKNDRPVTKMKYEELSNFQFAQAFEKVSSTPNLDGPLKCQVHRIIKTLNKARLLISQEFQEKLVPIYGEKNPDGSILRPPNEGPLSFKLIEDKQEEFKTAQEAFGKSEVALDTRPLTEEEIQKFPTLTPNDLEKLGPLYEANHS